MLLIVWYNTKRMHILIAGGAGFIGSHLSRFHIAKGDTVTVVDSLITGQESNITPLRNNKKFHYIPIDIVTDSIPQDARYDAIYHLASPASPNHHSAISYHALPMETMMVNTNGTLRLLETAKEHQAKFLFASTSEIYGDPLEHPQREEYRGNVSTTGPRSIYDEAKRFGETLTAFYHRDHQVDARIARIFNTYGPNMMVKDMRMIIVFINQALRNEPITIFGDGSQTRSLCYVQDLVEGLHTLIMHPAAKGEVVNLGAIEEHTVMEYATMVKEIVGSTSEIKCTEDLPKDDPKRRRPDITKARQLLRWQPQTPLQEGLLKTVEYFRSIAGS